MTQVRRVYYLQSREMLETIESVVTEKLPGHEMVFIGETLGFYNKRTHKEVIKPGHQYTLAKDGKTEELIYRHELFPQFVGKTVLEKGEVVYTPKDYGTKILYQVPCSSVSLDIYLNFVHSILNQDLPKAYQVLSKEEAVYYLLSEHYPNLYSILLKNISGYSEEKGVLFMKEILRIIPFASTLYDIYDIVNARLDDFLSQDKVCHHYTLCHQGNLTLIGDLGDYRINEYEKLKRLVFNRREEEDKNGRFNEDFTLLSNEYLSQVLDLNIDISSFAGEDENNGYEILKSTVV